MICLVAMLVFGILGIFSATHRRYAKEAFRCVFLRLTLRPCDTGFDQRIKAKITAKIVKRSPKLARFTHRNFEAISWAFTVLLVVSLVLTANGLYNLTIHGTCDPHNPEECIFTGLSKQASCRSPLCAKEGCECGENEEGCTQENQFAACEGHCLCDQNVCG